MVTLAIPTDSPVVIGPPQDKWTHTDWEKLPNDGNCYEILDGVLYLAIKPDWPYDWILHRLSILVGAPVLQKDLGISAGSPVGVVLPGGNIVVPDFMVKLGSRKPKMQAANATESQNVRPPELIVEILSPKIVPYMTKIKLQAYADAGVPEYAIIDPAKRTPRLYTLDAPGRYAGPREFDSTQTMSFACLPGIALEVGRLFAGAPDTTL